MKRAPSSIALVSLSLLAAACSSDSGGPIGPAGTVGTALSKSLRAVGVTASPQSRELERDLFEPAVVDTGRDVTPATCAEIGQALENTCNDLWSSEAWAWCIPQATFFYANDIPRCAGRLTVSFDSTDAVSELWAFDLSGTSYAGPAPECGNGNVEPGEDCDDGNHESWDGCDPNCQFEEFTGCEAVIENQYRIQGVAQVDQNLWDGPRSHLMVHHDAVALRAVDRGACDAAASVGADVCNELVTTMPFVAWCQPSAELFEDDLGPACAVRFEVTFQSRDPDSGVFTTALTGILAFTIR